MSEINIPKEAIQAAKDAFAKARILTKNVLEVDALTGRGEVYCAMDDTAIGKIIQAALPHLQQWQPIETAPKDLRPILIYVPAVEGEFYDGTVYVGWRYTDTRYTVLDNGKDIRSHTFPTHWMPLPEFPKRGR
jgi:hypothetical protein